MNSYGSNIRTYIARNIAEIAIAPPTDLVFTGQKRGIFRTAVVNPAHNFPWNINGNFFLRQIGLFCNFGENLILKTPAQRLDLQLELWTYREQPTAGGIINFTVGSKAVTGSGFLLHLVPGYVVLDAIGNPYIVDQVTDDNNGILCDYARSTGSTGRIQYLASPLQVANYRVELPDLSLLNTLIDYEYFIPSNRFASTSGLQQYYDKTLFFCEILNQDGGNAEFYTKGIPSSFSGAKAIFDVYMEIEFTPIIDSLVPTQIGVPDKYLVRDSVTVAENINASVV